MLKSFWHLVLHCVSDSCLPNEKEVNQLRKFEIERILSSFYQFRKDLSSNENNENEGRNLIEVENLVAMFRMNLIYKSNSLKATRKNDFRAEPHAIYFDEKNLENCKNNINVKGLSEKYLRMKT